ncbi:hypothetical protein BCEN4_740087 [Burkholderia cenocepacia]|nr:hypothetical protein BCEN4_740087 [Burkholderia cenocepacia]
MLNYSVLITRRVYKNKKNLIDLSLDAA